MRNEGAGYTTLSNRKNGSAAAVKLFHEWTTLAGNQLSRLNFSPETRKKYSVGILSPNFVQQGKMKYSKGRIPYLLHSSSSRLEPIFKPDFFLSLWRGRNFSYPLPPKNKWTSKKLLARFPKQSYPEGQILPINEAFFFDLKTDLV